MLYKNVQRQKDERLELFSGTLLQKQMDSWAGFLPQRRFAKHLVSCHNLWETSSIFLHLSAKSERPQRWQLWMCRVHRVSGREVCISSDSWADSEWLSNDRWHQMSPSESCSAYVHIFYTPGFWLSTSLKFYKMSGVSRANYRTRTWWCVKCRSKYTRLIHCTLKWDNLLMSQHCWSPAYVVLWMLVSLSGILTSLISLPWSTSQTFANFCCEKWLCKYELNVQWHNVL